MSLLLKKLSQSIALGLLLCGSVGTATAAGTDYSVKTMNTVSEGSTNQAGYNQVYSFALVTNGPNGYDDIRELNSLFIALKKAHKAEQLTAEGEKLFQLVDRVYPRLKSVSGDRLTDLGVSVVSNLGAEYAKNRRSYFSSRIDYENNISMLFSFNGDNLSLNTGENFVLGMTRVLGQETELIYEQGIDEKALAYYRQTEYKNYLNNYPDLEKVLGRLSVMNQNRSYIANVLPRIFKKKLLDEVSHIGLIDQAQRIKLEGKDIVLGLYHFYRIFPSYDPALAETVKAFFNESIMRESERNFFASIEGAETFYKYGPGFNNQKISKEAGKKFEEDLASEMSRLVEAGGKSMEDAGKLYFTDYRAALNILSFFMSDNLSPSLKPKDLITLTGEGSFDLSQIVPLNTMIVLDVYRNGDGELVLKMMVNGKDVKFRNGCFPETPDSYYYKWSMLEDCFIHDTGL